MPAPQAPARLRDGRAVFVYTVARMALFALCLALGWLAGLGGLVLLVSALLVSGALSWFLLQRQRLAMSASVDGSVERLRSRLRARVDAEDAYVDRMQGTTDNDRPT